MTSILVSPHIEADYGPDLRSLLNGARELVALHPGQTELAGVEAAFLSVDYMDMGANADVNPPLAAFLDAITRAPDLRWVHICSAGADRPVLRSLMSRGVTLTTSSGANAKSVAHSAIAGLMAMERNVAQWVLDKAAHHWTSRHEMAVPHELEGSRITIVGMGPIGQEIARVCQALDMRVTGVRRSGGAAAHFDEVVRMSHFREVLPRTDWLVIACPLTPDTRGLMSTETLALLPRTARLINIARGAIVDQVALNDALRGGTLGGAYSDVFEVEPLPADSPLWDAPNLLMSPHTGGRSAGFSPRTVQMFKANLARWINGDPLLHIAT